MESQVFAPAMYSLRTTDLLPPDDFDDEDPDAQWMEYCRCAAQMDRQHILECVLDDLDAEDSPIYDLIDSAIQEPHEPGRPKESITVLAGIGKAILHLVAKHIDDAVSMHMAMGVGR
jgi:hypothetical protein